MDWKSPGRYARLSWLPCLLLSAWVGLTPPAVAQKSNALVAVIDVQRILREAKASKSVAPQMEKLRKRYQGAVRKRETELRKASEDLQRQRAILSPEAFAKKRREYETKARAAQAEFQSRKRQLDGAFNIAMGKVQKSMLQVAAKIADSRNLDIVLPKSIIILSAKKLDITKDVLAGVDKQLPSVKVTLPKARSSGSAKSKGGKAK